MMKPTKQQTRKVIKNMGGAVAVSDMLGITHSAVSQWECIPVDRAVELEIATEGRFRKEDLRPDIFKFSNGSILDAA